MDEQLLKAIKRNTTSQKGAEHLLEIRNMARLMRDQQTEVKELEERLAKSKASLFQLATKDLPELFNEHKVRNITLEAEGNHPAYTVSVNPYYKAVLPKDNEDAGLRWLEENGHGDIIRRSYTINLDRDSEAQANELRSFLELHDLPFEDKETVPWTTLTAFVKEQVEKSNKSDKVPAPPLDLLGAFVGQMAKIKPVRE